MKRPPFHRHTSSSSTSSTPSNKTTPPPPTSTTTTTASKKGPAIKSTRPPVYHRKSASAHQFHYRNKSHQSLGKLLGAGSGPASHPVNAEDEQLEMATSFLQYCAMCEKQITVPSNSVLYCSESCRRKDSCKPLSASSYTYTMTSPSSSPINTNTHINMDSSSTTSSITSSPSKPIPVSRPLLGRIPSDLHDSKSDLDPTEWKPIISGCRHGRNGSSTSLASSDAWAYLSQFHYPRDDARISSSTPSLHAMPFRRAPTTRNSTTSLLAMGTPSLVNTPSTTTASSSVTSSPPSSSGDYISATATTSYGYGAYTYAADAAAAAMDPGRPLPPRHNPSFSTSAGATKGVELVVPHIITSAEEDGHVAGHEGLWMKV
ncbi:hypothetical protein TCE0_017r04263 [Talaromyces pinophilus]|uniref:Life-span regulatory factor-domain-containing protein n=1 Tax=Talaromyces pinophilus TaxID=128442 RepID=A0A6V8H320_TALPI|nr:hypothetical protein TCE0_017r04263 [Talaromyces pinophilus]